MSSEKAAPADPEMDRALSSFLSYLLNERNASQHTVDSYRLDIQQFAMLQLNADVETAQIDWNSVDVYMARTYIVKLQEELEVSRTSILRKLSGCARSTGTCSGSSWRTTILFPD